MGNYLTSETILILNLILNLILFIIIGLLLFGSYRLEKRVNVAFRAIDGLFEAMFKIKDTLKMDQHIENLKKELKNRRKQCKDKPCKWEV